MLTHIVNKRDSKIKKQYLVEQNFIMFTCAVWAATYYELVAFRQQSHMEGKNMLDT